jgi:hypothetical protein
MSEMDEMDLDLKLRMMRFLWYNGYYVKRNLDLVKYNSPNSSGGQRQYTDVDVFGLRIGEGFKQSTTICDCKSGTSASTNERIFWLSGVMSYLGAERGFFVRSKINERQYLEIGERLHITPLSGNQLSHLEKAYDIDSKPFIGSFNKFLAKKGQDIFEKMKEETPMVHDYLRSKYWTDRLQYQITSLILAESKINHLESLEDEENLFLQLHILSLLSLSVLKYAEPILVIAPDQRYNYINETILGGRIESMERKKLMEKFYDFMHEEIFKRYGAEYPLSKLDFLSFFYPNYLKYLIDLIERICLNPLASIHVPRILDIIAYEHILNKNDIIKEQFGLNDKNFSGALKIVDDFLIFGQRCGFLGPEIFDIMKYIVSNS